MTLGGITGPLLFLFSRRHKIYKLRRKYDKLREKANKVRDVSKRSSVFSVLDQVEPNLVILEEQNVSRGERNRMIKYIGSGLLKAEQILKADSSKESKQR
jgi:hypothetical protein